MFDLPTQHPFNEEQAELIAKLFKGLDAKQLQWLSTQLGQSFPNQASSEKKGSAVTILFGTESGNCEELAELSAKQAKKQGHKVNLLNMADCSPSDMSSAEQLLIIVSTWGDGEPPESAETFYNTLMNEELSFSDSSFSVCALGDTSYEQFCQTGKDIDARLEALGGKRSHLRVDCDVDYEEDHAQWLESVLADLGGNNGVSSAAAVAATPQSSGIEYGKKNPFPAPLLDKALLNGKGSAKETWHFELGLEGSGLSYEAGDALAVKPLNAPDVIETLLSGAGLNGSETVSLKDIGELPLSDALTSHLDITALSKNVAKKLQERHPDDKLAEMIEGDFKDYAWGREIVDLIEDFAPNKLAAHELVDILRKLPPRLYSIASSIKAHPEEVHLTVAAVRYHSHGKDRKGVASTFLPELAIDDTAKVFVQPNKNFRLPEDNSTPIIMVGPGTGVAPFRAFIEERAEVGGGGKNWMVFGDQHYSYDFLYQLEWQEYAKNGVLNRIDVAFSRDQTEKIYVQDRLREASAELYTWLEEGAHFYVCGDAARMAGDVHQALIDIVTEQSGKSSEEATQYLDELKKAKRYQRDVY